MKKIIFFTIIVLCVLSSVVYSSQDISTLDIPDIVEFSAKNGVVVFDHTIHTNFGECTICHHTEIKEKCSNCHSKKSKISLKKALHKTCKSCHKKLKQGPTKCKECHKK